LYFQTWVLLLPLFAYWLLLHANPLIYLAVALIGSAFQFSIRYEFATTFVLLWLLPVLMTQAAPGRLGFATFFLGSVGFTLALLIHHVQVAGALGISVGEASGLILKKAGTRNMSMAGVEAPWSLGFFQEVAIRMNEAGLSIPFLVMLRKGLFVLIFLVLWLTREDRVERDVLLWALICYISWYVFGYQHIMWHRMYDWLLFSVTLQLAILIVVGMRIAKRLNLPCHLGRRSPAVQRAITS
jgi:hypothetical protein